MSNTDQQNKEKKLAGEKAAEFLKDGMTVGLGTGSTVFFTINKIGEMVADGLKIKAVSSSDATSRLAESHNIKMISINDDIQIDLTIDGADEADKYFNGIKGGGGALLFEKIIALSSKKNIWIIDSNKMVEKLGKYPLPVEIIPFGYKRVFERLSSMNLNPSVRMRNNEFFLTDSGNFIFDLHLKEINDPVKLDKELKMITGIVETGLFINIADTIIIGKENSTEILHK
ncbi:MAG TPA: ribose-5-phosphate isomerase RpiA [Ignavibacteria bacterium]|nr:ribose-5-phosphate isomerase RpiA [Ignavibacteria bacterium]